MIPHLLKWEYYYHFFLFYMDITQILSVALLSISPSWIGIADVLVNVWAWTGLRYQNIACEGFKFSLQHTFHLNGGTVKKNTFSLAQMVEKTWSTAEYASHRLPKPALCSVPSADVGCRSHCGRGPGPGWLYGILHLQEMPQQGQEAQESAREESRTRPKEEGQGRRRWRGWEEGEERCGGHCVPCPPKAFLLQTHLKTFFYYSNSRVHGVNLLECRVQVIVWLSTRPPSNATGHNDLLLGHRLNSGAQCTL